MKISIVFTLLMTIAFTSQLPIERQEIQGRITKGFSALVGQFPYMVYLEVEVGVGYRMHCGGSLISRRWILSAAHCIDGPGTGNIIHIYLGSTDTEDADIGYAIWLPDAVRVHPFWNSRSMHNDIGLIEIPDTTLCTKIATVPLPPLNTKITQTYVGDTGVASGWGKMADYSDISTRLQWGRMIIANNQICQIFIPWIGNTEICVDTSIDFVSSCDGDSGGPFVSESTGELLGILSHGIGDLCEVGKPIILTRVASYVQWIKSITGISY